MMPKTPRRRPAKSAVDDVLGFANAAVARIKDGRTDQVIKLAEYIHWALAVNRHLRPIVGREAADELMFGGRYRELLQMLDMLRASRSDTAWPAVASNAKADARSAVEGMVERALVTELHDVGTALMSLGEQLQAEAAHWKSTHRLVVLDTSFYLTQTDLPNVPLGKLIDAGPTSGWGFHVVVPMVVLDELDNLKDRGERGEGGSRVKARTALKHLDAAWREGERRGDERMRRGALRDDPSEPITVELLPDPRGHVRLPIADDEIVDRAVWVQETAGTHVTLVTYDLGHAARGKLAGLVIKHMTHDQPSRP